RCNFVDGTSGTTYLRLVGSEGSMDVKWEEVVLRRNQAQPGDAFAQAKAQEAGEATGDRKRMVPPQEVVFQAEQGYRGAHYDHFRNWLYAIRHGGTVVEDPVFGFRAAAPALLCNDSYHQNTYIQWDPVTMKVI
ncbi:MAG: gfo/Idh/MocA family oxidoreductase, partial [Bacteroidota bacterium]